VRRAFQPPRMGHGIFTPAAVRASQILSVSGNKIVDSAGRTVYLRGFSHSSPEYSPIYPGSTQFYDDATPYLMDRSARLGANMIRIPLNQAAWLGTVAGNESVTGANYRAAIVALVTAARSYGLYVIVELHWNDPRPTPDTTYQGSQQQMPDRQNSLAFWTSVATQFKADTGVILELYNEPNVVNWSEWLNGGKSISYFNTNGSGAISMSTLGLPDWTTAGMQELVNTVRATGATNIIVVNGLNYSASLGQNAGDCNGDPTLGWLANKPTDPLQNLVAGTHFYPDQPYTKDYSNPGSRYFHSPSAATVLTVATYYPVLIGEYGDKRTTPLDNFAPLVLPWAEKNGLHHCAWTLNDWTQDNTLVSSFFDTNNPYEVVPNAGLGALALPYISGRRQITKPNTNISAGRPIYASTTGAGNVSNITQGRWDTSSWQSTGFPADVSLDLSGVTATQRTHLSLVWSTNNYIGDSTLTGGTTYRSPGDYVIQGNAGAGGGAPPASGWVDLVTVTGNKRRSRSHRFDFCSSLSNSKSNTPFNWLRIHFTAGQSENEPTQPQVSIAHLDVFDVTAGGHDTWFIFGDSITAEGARFQEGMGAAWISRLTGTGYAPLIETVGAPFYHAVDFGINYSGTYPTGTQTAGGSRTEWLNLLNGTAAHNVLICLGTNDAAGTPNTTQFYNHLRTMIDDCLSRGKRPWVAKIPWSPDTTRQGNTTPLNTKIAQLYTEYGSAIGVGPDFYTYYAAHPEAWIGDTVHPTGDWTLWGEEVARVIATTAYPSNQSSWVNPTIDLAA